MKCYDCGHSVHEGDCIECLCPTFRDPIDESLRERPRKDSLAEDWPVEDDRGSGRLTTMAIQISRAEQDRQADMRARSAELAVERGHMRRN